VLWWWHLPVFKTIPVVDAIYRAQTLPDRARAFTGDTIALGWEDRMKTRGRRRSDGGTEFGTALPRGTVLRAGDRLVVESAQVVVAVVERPEPVFVVEPRTPPEWGLFAYHIGNGHQPLMVTDRGLVCPDLPGVEMLLKYHGIPYVRDAIAFTPTTAAGHVDI
jgi:urease accessory protein